LRNTGVGGENNYVGKNVRAIFAANMTALRLSRGLTFEKAADLYGVSMRQVAKYEKRGNWPKPEILDNIADTYRVTVDQLMGRTLLVPVAEPDQDKGNSSAA